MQIKAGTRFYHAGDASLGNEGDLWVIEKDAKQGDYAVLCYCGDAKLPDGHKWTYVDVIVRHDCLQEIEFNDRRDACRSVDGGIYHRELQVTEMWIGGNLIQVRHAGTVTMDLHDMFENSEGMIVEPWNTLAGQMIMRKMEPTTIDNALIAEATEWAQRDMWLTPEIGGYLSWMLLHDDAE